MSLMLRLLSLLVLSTSISYAVSNSEILKFNKINMQKFPNMKLVKQKVRKSFELDDYDDWEVFVIDVSVKVKTKTGDQDRAGQVILYAKDDVVLQGSLFDLHTGKQANVLERIVPEFQKSFYKKANLLYGNANAKHKIAIFSDPLCPFCIGYVPKVIKYVKKHPKTFALYYYHLPLSMHPAAKGIAKCMTAAMRKGEKNIVERTYSAKFEVQETNEKKILNAYNKALGLKLKMSDMTGRHVLNHVAIDKNVADKMLVHGTPTVFFDGKLDESKTKYTTVKKID